ncbi:substrate-binding periplasmic protein [Aestuariispira insulae]|nr:transporter substrate-binding domain-containing protein [Aestuariispira insulae]
MMRLTAFLIANLVLFLISAVSVAAQETVIQVNAAEWPPYTKPGLKHQGVIARIIREAFLESGYRSELNFRPWKRALIEGQQGKVDAVSFSVRSPEREAIFLYSDQLFSMTRYFYHLKNKPFDWQELSDLEGKTIGIDLGFSYRPELEEMAQNGLITLLEGRHARNSLQRLLTGRIDLFAMSRDYPEYVLKTEFSPEEANQITYHPTPFEEPEFFLLFGKVNPRATEYRDAFNRGLAVLRQSGRFEQYFEESRRGDYLPDK